MTALEEWLMLQLLEHNVNMLRVEAEAKARVLALLIVMQKDIVSLLANAPELSELGKLAKNALLRESNQVIADYYGKAQLAVDLGGVAEVEALGTKQAIGAALEKVAGKASVEIRIGLQLPTENYLQKLASDALVQGSPAKNWWLRQAQDTQFKLANEIRIGAAQGETNAQIIKRIVGQEVTAKAPADAVPIPGVMPLARKNAAAIVQTSMATVAAEARRATFQANADIANGIMQVSTLDSHTSLTCIAYSGATWDLDYQPILENDLPYNGGVPRHFNCLPGDALVLPRSGITGVSKRWFDGEVVVIRTAGGRELTSTPNHPILTSCGWVAARLINVGSDVVCDGGSEWRGVVDGDHQHMPARIEDEFSSFFAAREVLPVPVPLTAKDFHGDGIGSKVAVVWTESFLRSGDDSAFGEHGTQTVFVDGSTATAANFGCGGHGEFCSIRARATPNRVMSGTGERDPICPGSSSHPGELLGAAVSGFDAIPMKDRFYSSNGNSEPIVDSSDANAGLKKLDDVSVGCIGCGKLSDNRAFQSGPDLSDAAIAQDRRNHDGANPIFGGNIYLSGTSIVGSNNVESGERLADAASQLHFGRAKDIEYRSDADAELARNILNGESGAVFLDDVVAVSIRSFSGHVYNLETVDGWYSGNGIVTHNCRSAETMLLKTLREMGIDMDEPDPGMRASSNGPISAKTTMAEYLKLKGADYQNETLGPGRAELFRQGKLTVREIVDMSGRPLKLSDLRAKYAQ